MAEPRILVSRDKGSAGPRGVLDPEAAWTVAGWVGLLFLLVGGFDFGNTFWPLSLGSPEWEFGTITASLNGMPVPTLGLALLMASGLAAGRRWQVRLIGLVLAALVVLLVVMAFLYATNVPIALGAVTEPMGRLGLKKAIAKTAVQLVCYPAIFLVLAVWGWRRTRTS